MPRQIASRVSKAPEVLAAGNDILVLAGQSNTVGYGLGPYVQSDTSNDSRIFQVGRRGASNMTIIPIAEKLDFWPAGGQAHGYGPSLARYYARTYLAPNRNLIIVPAAHGETSVLEWLQIVTGVSAGLYDDMAARINLALAQPGENRIIGHSQELGETDTLIIANPSDPWYPLMSNAGMFQARMLDYIDKFRGDFGDVPFVNSKFSSYWNAPGQAAVEATFDVIAGLRPRCATVVTTGSTTNQMATGAGGNVHLSAAGQEEQAVRHFDALSVIL